MAKVNEEIDQMQNEKASNEVQIRDKRKTLRNLNQFAIKTPVEDIET